MSTPDIIYYNLSLFNDTNNNVAAQISDSRQDAIVFNPSEYEGSITRFTVDANWPLFIPNIPNPAFPLQTNISITFSFMGNFFQQFVSVTPQEAKQGVFDISIFLNDLNQAALAAWNALRTALPPGPANPPFFALNAPTGLISMYVGSDWVDANINPYNIYFNVYLQNLLGLPFNIQSQFPAPNGTDYQIAVKTYSPVLPAGAKSGYPFALSGYTDPVLQVSQDYDQLSEFSDIATIQFTTQMIPVVSEYLPDTPMVSDQNSNVSANFLSIITDFVITRQDAKPRDNSFVYLPTAEYRMFSLLGNVPLRRLDIQAYFTTYGGHSLPLFLPPDGSMTLKLMFRKKKNNKF
jgi:hypothetical protein